LLLLKLVNIELLKKVFVSYKR